LGRWSAAGDRARRKAEAEYAKGWNLRPARGAHADLADAIASEARALRGVRTVTFAEARGDGGGPMVLKVGILVDPRFGGNYADARTVLAEAAAREGARGAEFEELEADVDPTLDDGSPNPYVVFTRAPR
jgi:hypothetical protein